MELMKMICDIGALVILMGFIVLCYYKVKWSNEERKEDK